MSHLFGLDNKKQLRWSPDYFPFTDPSLELEVQWSSANTNLEAELPWLEVLGSGVLQNKVLQAGDVNPKRVQGWAFGFGLWRLGFGL